ncbi:uncharacterized protein LOC143031493 [Oratosquilla oratoria]|uniref:uncharacterized protein LOC143031493 n=1 Tax=Oratosquilla oratoria TaxID=337810 RepID=UPI003F7594C0
MSSALVYFLLLHLLLLVPSGETIRCYECVWYERQPTKKLSYETNEACSPKAFNKNRAPVKTYSEDHACVSLETETDEGRSVVLMGMPLSELDSLQTCTQTTTNLGELEMSGKVCNCQDDLCNIFPSAGYRPDLALGWALLASSLLFLLQILA